MWKLFKIKNKDTRTISMASLSSVVIVNCDLILNFFSNNFFKVCCVHTENINGKHFWRQDHHALCLSSLKVWPQFINKQHLQLYQHSPTGESERNFCEGVYFRRWFWLKKCGSHSKWSAAHLSFYQLFFIDFACWKTN